MNKVKIVLKILHKTNSLEDCFIESLGMVHLKILLKKQNCILNIIKYNFVNLATNPLIHNYIFSQENI